MRFVKAATHAEGRVGASIGGCRHRLVGLRRGSRSGGSLSARTVRSRSICGIDLKFVFRCVVCALNLHRQRTSEEWCSEVKKSRSDWPPPPLRISSSGWCNQLGWSDEAEAASLLCSAQGWRTRVWAAHETSPVVSSALRLDLLGLMLLVGPSVGSRACGLHLLFEILELLAQLQCAIHQRTCAMTTTTERRGNNTVSG